MNHVFPFCPLCRLSWICQLGTARVTLKTRPPHYNYIPSDLSGSVNGRRRPRYFLQLEKIATKKPATRKPQSPAGRVYHDSPCKQHVLPTRRPFVYMFTHTCISIILWIHFKNNLPLLFHVLQARGTPLLRCCATAGNGTCQSFSTWPIWRSTSSLPLPTRG